MWRLAWNCGSFYFTARWLISPVSYRLSAVCRFDRDLMACWDSALAAVAGTVSDGGAGAAKLGKLSSRCARIAPPVVSELFCKVASFSGISKHPLICICLEASIQ